MVVLAIVVVAVPAHAQFLLRQVNLAYLARRADIIVQGRVVAARYESHPDYPNVPTVLVTLRVEQMLRGPRSEFLSFREFLPPRSAQIGKRGYQVGQRLLLFLPSPSRYGLSSPIGREQGRFHILRDAQGRDRIENEFGNAGLFKSVPEAAEQAGARLAEEELRTTSVKRGPVPLEDFVSLVRTLSALPRIE